MTSPTDGDCRCVWGRDEDGLPECQDGDCRCPQHCVDEDTGLPMGEAVPQWRALVDAGLRHLTREDPLVVVLRSLSNVADPTKDTTANLARVVSICEAQVGDGWQADPRSPRLWSAPPMTATAAPADRRPGGGEWPKLTG
jgi:hypothetical protein